MLLTNFLCGSIIMTTVIAQNNIEKNRIKKEGPHART
mgnify:FL=1